MDTGYDTAIARRGLDDGARAGDRDVAAVAAVATAANARGNIAAHSRDVAALYDDRAASFAGKVLKLYFAAVGEVPAADARAILLTRGLSGRANTRVERTRAFDGQRAAFRHIDALENVQHRALGERQRDVAIVHDVDAVVDRHRTDRGHVCSPVGAILRHHLIVGHDDLIGDTADNDLHPLRGGEGLLRCYDPFAVFKGRVEQAVVADGHGLCRAGQAQFGQYLRKRHRGVALHHVFQIIIGEFHGIQREAVRGSRDRFGDFVHVGVQLLRGQFAAVLGHVVDVGLQVFVRRPRHGKRHLDMIALRGLDLLAVEHDLDVIRVAGGYVLAFVADFVDGLVRFPPRLEVHQAHFQLCARRERPGLRANRYRDGAYGTTLVEGRGLFGFFDRLRFHLKGDLQRLVRYSEWDGFNGDIPFRRGGVCIFAGNQ